MWVIHLIFSLNVGGTENMLLDITREQAKQEKVLLIIVNNDYNRGLLASVSDKVKVIRIDRKPGSKNVLHVLDIIRLNALLLYYKPVAIHCHNQQLINTLFMSKLKKKAVFTAHTTGLNFSLMKKYSHCYAISKGVKADILRQGSMAVEVIYNGVDAQSVRTKQQWKELSVPFMIAQMGRLDHCVKGQDLLLYALKGLIDAGIQDIQIDFYGDGASRGFLEELTIKLELTKYVRFLGSVDRKEIYQHFKCYDLLIQPSYKEGFGLTVVEAMVAGVPVLISDLEGPMEIINEGEYGFYFKTGDIEDLKALILWIMSRYDTASMKDIADSAGRHARQKFDIRQTAQHYLDAYKSL